MLTGFGAGCIAGSGGVELEPSGRLVAGGAARAPDNRSYLTLARYLDSSSGPAPPTDSRAAGCSVERPPPPCSSCAEDSPVIDSRPIVDIRPTLLRPYARARQRYGGRKVTVRVRGRLAGAHGRCGGRVLLATRVRDRVLARRRAQLGPGCRYSTVLRFGVRRLPRRLRPRPRSLILTVRARFPGSSSLLSDAAPPRRVRVSRLTARPRP